MGKIYDNFLEEVDSGMQGGNKGIPYGMPRLESVVFGVQKARYDLIAGKTSAGKTSFVDQCYVVEPFYQKLRNPNLAIDILYFSLEISALAKFSCIASRFLFDEFGLEVDPSSLFSRGHQRLSPEVRSKLDSLKGAFDKLEEMLHIYDKYTTADGIAGKIDAFMSERGTVEQIDGRTVYTPNNPDLTVIVITDTINLLSQKAKETKKQAIDKLSMHFVKRRNVYGLSIAALQQLNASISDPRRVALKRYEPIVDDLEDSKWTSKDCDVMLTVYDPLEAGIPEHRGYIMSEYHGNFRQIQVLKNRYGTRGHRVGAILKGNVLTFKELPKANTI